MIEFDYRIVRNEGDEQRTYTPSIPTQLQDLVCIEGPNSSGKSTLLHILALGLFGLKNDNIKDSLQRKLQDLAGSSHQAVTFSLSIKNAQHDLLITSEKRSPNSQEIIVRETVNGKKSILTPELFQRKYNLVYDIPDDPLERLDELTKELKDRQSGVGTGMRRLELRLRETITEVKNSQDPKKLEEFKRLRRDASKLIDELAQELQRLEKDRLCLERHYASRYLLEYRNRKAEAGTKLQSLEKQLKGIERKERSVYKQVEHYSDAAEGNLESIQTMFQEIYVSLKTMRLSTKDDYLALWKDQDLRNLFVDQEKHYILFNGIKTFRDQIKELDRSISQDGKLEEASFLSELIGLLQHYSGLKATLPGTDQTIPEFQAALEKRYNDCKEIKSRHEKLLQMDANLKELEEKSRFFINIYIPLLRRALKEKDTIEGDDREEELEGEIARLKQEIEGLNTKSLYFRDELIRTGADEKDADSIVTEIEQIEHLRPYSMYSEHELNAKLEDLRGEIDSLEKRKGESEYNKARYEHEIHRLEQQKPHKYQTRLDDLQRIYNQVQILAQRILKQYDENLKMLQSKRIRKQELDKSQLAYFDAVAVYLGRRVGTIRHVDKDYPVRKIDLLDRKILTDTNKVIMLTDLGTGQSQSAYLKGLLSSKDNRKLIALIDEVAMMDNRSMKPIFELLRNKYAEGSLLAAVVVQKGESLGVKPIPGNGTL